MFLVQSKRAEQRPEKSVWGGGEEKSDRGAELNNNKKTTMPTNSKTSELTSSLLAETTWLAAFLMRLFTNNRFHK